MTNVNTTDGEYGKYIKASGIAFNIGGNGYVLNKDGIIAYWSSEPTGGPTG